MATTKRKPGRPKAEVIRGKVGTARFTEEEWELVKACAKKNDLTVTQLVREGTLKMVESLQ